MGDHVSVMEAQFSRLASMGSDVFKSMKVPLVISSLGNWPEYWPMIA